MNINIKATKTTLSQSVKTYVNQKMTALENFIKPEDKVRVELELASKHKTGLVFRAEIEIQPRGQYADARGNDFYEAFDLVIPKIKEQLTRQKDKAVSLRRRRQKVA